MIMMMMMMIIIIIIIIAYIYNAPSDALGADKIGLHNYYPKNNKQYRLHTTH